jgi:phosphoribosylaminoimidazole (AIR) synthetase
MKMEDDMKVDLYKQDGVDISAGDAFSAFSGELCRNTYRASRFVDVVDLSRGNFRGPRGFTLKGLPEGYIITGGMDGVGTKVVVIDAAGNFSDAASNLLAMTGMDITRWGGLPLVFLNILDVRSLGEIGSEKFEACQEIMNGLYRSAYAHGFVLLGGETAELGPCVGSENPDAKVMFNWGGCMIGVYHPQKMILGDTLRPGQKVMVLADDFRSNGISSLRKALALKYGSEWWKNMDAVADILAAASPSVLYDRFLNLLHGWFNAEANFSPRIPMHLIVHLSGGAFESKLGKDMLEPLGLAAYLPDLFEPPDIMKKCAEWRGMSPKDCYKTWNGGQGALVVIDEPYQKEFIEIAEKNGIAAKVAGTITEKKEKYTVAIHSQFGDGNLIDY